MGIIVNQFGFQSKRGLADSIKLNKAGFSPNDLSVWIRIYLDLINKCDNPLKGFFKSGCLENNV